MAQDEYDDEPEIEEKDPKGFNRTGFQIKHVLGKALKGAVLGVVAAIAIGLVGLFMGGWLGLGIASFVGLTGVGMSTVGGLLALGAGLGALVGAVLSDPSGAADDKAAEINARKEQFLAKQRRLSAMKMQTEKQLIEMERQKGALGLASVSADPGLPPMLSGKDAGQGRFA